MVSTGIVQLFNIQNEGDFIHHLGYPQHFLQLLGTWKLLGVLALLIPGYPKIREWAYAGFFFLTTGAAYAHIANGDGLSLAFPSIFLFCLLLISWFLRPYSNKPQTIIAG